MATGSLLGLTTSATAAPEGVPPTGVDSSVAAWGFNSGRQSDVPASLNGKVVTAASAGHSHSLALTNDGTITA